MSTTTKSRFQWIQDINPEPIQWLVKDILPTHSKAMLAGDTGSAKSFFSIGLACSIATGIPFHKSRVMKSGTVVYLAGEGAGGIRNRVRAWEIKNQAEVSNFLVSKGINLLEQTKGAIQELKSMEVEPVLFVFDTLNRSMSGGDENSANDASQVLNSLDVLEQAFPDCTSLLVHHTGHADKGRARGSAAWEQGMDVQLHMEGGAGQNVSTLTFKKMKEAELPTTKIKLSKVVVDLEILDDEGQPVTSLVLDQIEAGKDSAGKPLLAKNGKALLDILKSPNPTEPTNPEPIGNDWVMAETVRSIWSLEGRPRTSMNAGLKELLSHNLIMVEYTGTEERPIYHRIKLKENLVIVRTCQNLSEPTSPILSSLSREYSRYSRHDKKTTKNNEIVEDSNRQEKDSPTAEVQHSPTKNNTEKEYIPIQEEDTLTGTEERKPATAKETIKKSEPEKEFCNECGAELINGTFCKCPDSPPLF